MAEQDVSVKSAGEQQVPRGLTERGGGFGRSFDELRQTLADVLAISRSQREYLDKEPQCCSHDDRN
jgi:hypothetical protein